MTRSWICMSGSSVSPGHLQRRLKGVRPGAETSLSANLRSYNKSFAHHAANMELQQEISQPTKPATDFIKNDKRDYVKNNRLGQQRHSGCSRSCDIRIKQRTVERQRQRGAARRQCRPRLCRDPLLRRSTTTSCRTCKSTTVIPALNPDMGLA